VAESRLDDCAKKTDACVARVAKRLKPDANGDINIRIATYLWCMARVGHSGPAIEEYDPSKARTDYPPADPLQWSKPGGDRLPQNVPPVR
jgi:hypothetical protein